MESPADRLRKLRLAFGFQTAADACARFGWPVGTYRSHENGNRELSRKAAESYAKAFKTTAGFLLFGEKTGAPQHNHNDAIGLNLSHKTQNENDFVAVVQVPVRGEVSAGRWLEFDDFNGNQYDPIYVIAGRYPVTDQFAFKVSGTSMDKARLCDGDFVICVPYWKARAAMLPGDMVVVERRRAGVFERTVKELVIQEDQYELWPRSTDPRFQQPIVIPKNKDMAEADGTEVEIIGLVIASYVSRSRPQS